MILIHKKCIVKSVKNIKISLECLSAFEKVIILIALFCRIIKGLRVVL